MVGYGMSADAFHVTAPPEDGDGAFRVMRNALRDAGHRAASDRLHQRARHLDRRGRPRRDQPPSSAASASTPIKVAVSSTKSMTGHLLGGAGGLEAGITVLAIRDQIAPPTINYETPDPECDLDYVPNHARPMRDRVRACRTPSDSAEPTAPSFSNAISASRLSPLQNMKIVVCIKQVPARDSQLRVDVVGRVDSGCRSQLRDQRARRLRLRRRPAIEGETRRRSGGAVRRTGARRANHPRSPGQGRRPRHPHRGRGSGRVRSAGRGAPAGRRRSRPRSPTWC